MGAFWKHGAPAVQTASDPIIGGAEYGALSHSAAFCPNGAFSLPAPQGDSARMHEEAASVSVSLRLRRPVTDALRQGVREDLPELAETRDAALRERAIEAWAIALAGSSFQRISEIQGAALPEMAVLRRGGQDVHLRGVAHLSLVIARHMKSLDPGVDIDEDIVLVGALCHDLGKPYEFDPVHRSRWQADPSRDGFPPMRHTVFGAHIALAAGLPESIAHIALAHSGDGDKIVRSLECSIVHHADELWWKIAAGCGLLLEASIRGVLKNFEARALKAPA